MRQVQNLYFQQHALPDLALLLRAGLISDFAELRLSQRDLARVIAAQAACDFRSQVRAYFRAKMPALGKVTPQELGLQVVTLPRRPIADALSSARMKSLLANSSAQAFECLHCVHFLSSSSNTRYFRTALSKFHVRPFLGALNKEPHWTSIFRQQIQKTFYSISQQIGVQESVQYLGQNKFLFEGSAQQCQRTALQFNTRFKRLAFAVVRLNKRVVCICQQRYKIQERAFEEDWVQVMLPQQVWADRINKLQQYALTQDQQFYVLSRPPQGLALSQLFSKLLEQDILQQQREKQEDFNLQNLSEIEPAEVTEVKSQESSGPEEGFLFKRVPGEFPEVRLKIECEEVQAVFPVCPAFVQADTRFSAELYFTESVRRVLGVRIGRTVDPGIEVHPLSCLGARDPSEVLLVHCFGQLDCGRTTVANQLLPVFYVRLR